jgi:methionyl-tRNA synthetase
MKKQTKKNKILITSALPYANGPIHFGHIAGAYLPGDCYATFKRLQGDDVLYICGSDEYGVAITLSAELAGRSPKEHVDEFHEVNKNLFNKLHFHFDNFSRTTWEGHQKPVQQYFLDLLANGYIEEKTTDQLFSKEEGRFLADRYVKGTCPKCKFAEARGDECPSCGASYEALDLINPVSKLTSSTLIKKETKHWFIRLDLFKEKLLKWIETKEWKPHVLNFSKNFIENLRPRAITRDSLWGVPIPLEDPDAKTKCLYVWFDAPIGYISSTMEWALKQGDQDLWKKYWCDQETKLIHFIGKDNIPFHAVIFPAMTMGQNLPLKLVDDLPANEFYMLEGRQFSKSDGWTIDLEDFFSKYTADQIRYTIASNAPETQDAEFTWDHFQQRCNNELLAKFGNFIHRVLVFAQNNCARKIPKKEIKEIDQKFLDTVKKLADETAHAYDHYQLRLASKKIMELAQEGNIYFNEKMPWKTIKDPKTAQDALTTIACCLECVKALALIAYPILKEASPKILQMLGLKVDMSQIIWEDFLNEDLKEGSALIESIPLFRKIEDEEILKEVENLKKNSQIKNYTPLKEAISIDEVNKLDLRVGQILSAEEVEKSKKLFKLSVDLGFEKRVIVSGIKESFKKEDLIGKKVIVIANLKPAKIMGIESQGMLLAAGEKGALELPALEAIVIGTVVS